MNEIIIDEQNIKRFPENFRFQLTKEELQNLRSQIVTFKENLKTKYLPYAFTEQGVSNRRDYYE